ncbi:MAG TPA: O-antigen ligase family protein [Longimicrobiales bacterium]
MTRRMHPARGAAARGAGVGPRAGPHAPAAVAVARAPATADRWDPLLLFVALMLLTSLWRIQEIWPPLATLQAPSLAFTGAGACWLLGRDPRRSLRRLKHPVTWIAVALTVHLVASVPGSVYGEGSYHFLKEDHAKTLLLAALLAASIRSFVDLRRLAGIQVFGAAIYSAFALRDSAAMVDGRMTDLLYYDANDFGMLVVATAPLAIFFFTHGRTARVRFGALVAFALFTIGMVKSGSRAAFLAFGALTSFMLLRYRAVPAGRRIAAIVGAVILVALAGQHEFWVRMRTMLHPAQDYNWVGNEPDGRMEIWKRGIGYMLDRPLFGVGVGVFDVADGLLAPQARRQQYGMGWRWAAAHNSFVQIGAETGVVGLLLFVAMLGSALRTTVRIAFPAGGPDSRTVQAAMGQALTGVLMVYCVNGFFLSQAYGVLLYSTLALVVGLARVCPPAPAPGPRRR